MATALIYAGIAVGIVAIAAAFVLGTQNQQNYVRPDAVQAPAALEGSINPSGSGFAPTINKEKWHEDPFGDIASQVRAKAGQ